LTVLHITASAQTLRERLLARGRESSEVVEARVQRALEHALPAAPDVLEVRNDSTLDVAGARLLQQLQGLAGWPVVH
jgi:ribose 1,5-bisphosphokinase